jgi:hypothetical protein
VPHVDRDDLGVLGGEEFRLNVAAAVGDRGWVFDGFPYYVEEWVYPEAQLVVALDYSRAVVMKRVLIRSLRLSMQRRPDRTPAPMGLRDWLDPEGAPRWAWTSWQARRNEIAALPTHSDLSGTKIVQLRSPAATKRWLNTLA